MKKIICQVMVAVVLLSSLHAADYLRNSKFLRLDDKGVPQGWSLRDTRLKPGIPPRPADAPPFVRTEPGAFILNPLDGNYEVFLIHGNTPLPSPGRYVLEYEVSSPHGTSFRGVVSYRKKNTQGRQEWKSLGGVWKKALPEPQKQRLPFELPAGVQEVLVYFNASGKGSAEFRNIRLRDAGADLSWSQELAIYAPGEPVKFQVENLLDSRNRVRFLIRDFYGAEIRRGEVSPGETVSLTPPANGYYETTLEEFDGSGKRVFQRRRTFAVIPEVPEEVRKSPGNPYGAMVNTHYHYPFEEKEMDAKFMHRLGIRYVRTHRLNWINCQAGPDKPIDWREADAEVALYRRYGIRPVATTGWHTPVWASEARDTDFKIRGNFMPKQEYYPLHRNFYQQLAARYKGKIAAYEIGNEVDSCYFWQGRLKNTVAGDQQAVLQDYVDYFIMTSSALHAGDPEAKVGPGTTGAVPKGHTFQPWMERFWNSPAVQHADVFCTHYNADLREVKQVMKRYKRELPILMTEIGGLVKTDIYEPTDEQLRELIKLTYSQFTRQLNQGAGLLCKFLLRQIPGVRQGWISEMMESDYTIRPELVAYATLIRLTAAGVWEKELNVTANAERGWLQGYLCRNGKRRVNVLLLNDTEESEVVLRSPESILKLVDIMGNERTLPTVSGQIKLTMKQNEPLFVIGELLENPGEVKHPEPKLVLKRELTLPNAGFEAAVKNGRLPGWGIVVDEMSGKGKLPDSFKVESDFAVKSSGSAAIRLSSGVQTGWYGILLKLPMKEIPVPAAGEYVIFKISYDQKGESVLGTGCGLTLAFRDADMKRVSYGGGNWDQGTFDWTAKSWSGKYDRFHRDTRQITLEFYLGQSVGTVWLDNVRVEIELYRKGNAAADYRD